MPPHGALPLHEALSKSFPAQYRMARVTRIFFADRNGRPRRRRRGYLQGGHLGHPTRAQDRREICDHDVNHTSWIPLSGSVLAIRRVTRSPHLRPARGATTNGVHALAASPRGDFTEPAADCGTSDSHPNGQLVVRARWKTTLKHAGTVSGLGERERQRPDLTPSSEQARGGSASVR